MNHKKEQQTKVLTIFFVFLPFGDFFQENVQTPEDFDKILKYQRFPRKSNHRTTVRTCEHIIFSKSWQDDQGCS